MPQSKAVRKQERFRFRFESSSRCPRLTQVGTCTPGLVDESRLRAGKISRVQSSSRRRPAERKGAKSKGNFAPHEPNASQIQNCPLRYRDDIFTVASITTHRYQFFSGYTGHTMGCIRHKRNHHARRDVSRAARTRARKLDSDQIHANYADPAKRTELENPSELDADKAGLGAYYCIPCDRHFPSEGDREVHQKSKLHKRRVKKVLEEEPYTNDEAYRAAGIGVDNKQRDSQGKAIAKSQSSSSSTSNGTTQQLAAVEES